MSKNIFINPVSPSAKQKKYPSPQLHTKELLKQALEKRGCDIIFGKPLKGGVISQVYEATYLGKPVVVKHTENLVPFDPTEIYINKQGHIIDYKVLKLLQNSSIKVPKLIKFFPDITTTIMEDVRVNGFELLNNLILQGKLPLTSAGRIGESLAKLIQESRKWKNFRTNESAQESIYERGLELRLAYPNNQTQYLALENEYVNNSQHWLWPDNHPKNMFINDQGEVMFIDFGRSHWADHRYMPPNFLAHIVIYALAGFINKNAAVKYIQECVEAYQKYEPTEENIFCQYLAMEVLHRAQGKWIDGINTAKQKTSLYGFGLTVFDKNVNTVDKLLSLIL